MCLQAYFWDPSFPVNARAAIGKPYPIVGIRSKTRLSWCPRKPADLRQGKKKWPSVGLVTLNVKLNGDKEEKRMPLRQGKWLPYRFIMAALLVIFPLPPNTYKACLTDIRSVDRILGTSISASSSPLYLPGKPFCSAGKYHLS